MATYQVTIADAKPYIRRNVVRYALTAVAVIVMSTAFSLLWDGAAATTMFGFGLGVAAAIVCQALIEYNRVRATYAAEGGPIQLTVAEDHLVFVSGARETKIRRAPPTRVTETPNAFLVSVSAGSPPVLVPRQHLSAEETALLRSWAHSH